MEQSFFIPNVRPQLSVLIEKTLWPRSQSDLDLGNWDKVKTRPHVFIQGAPFLPPTWPSVRAGSVRRCYYKKNDGMLFFNLVILPWEKLHVHISSQTTTFAS